MKTSERDRGGFVLLAGGILLVVSLFLHWEDSFTAWHEFPNLRIIILLIAVVGIVFAVLDETGRSAHSEYSRAIVFQMDSNHARAASTNCAPVELSSSPMA